MKNSTVLILIGILIVGGGVFVFANTKSPQVVDSAVGSGNAQQITLSEKDFNYYPSTVTVQAGKPVAITLDNKVKGCLRSLAIPQLGLTKYLRTATDSLIFTPTQKGTYTIQCSMGMGFGKLVVQ